jgi:hypothetical protein
MMANWSFDWLRKECSSVIARGDYHECYLEYLKSDLSQSHPSVRSSVPSTVFLGVLRSAAVLYAAKPDYLPDVWTSLHLAWRMWALGMCGKLSYLEKLLEMNSKGTLPRREKLFKLISFDLSEIVMLVAAADRLRITDGKKYFIEKLQCMLQTSETYFDAKAFTTGPIEVLMLNVIFKDTGVKKAHEIVKAKTNDYVSRIWDNWTAPDAFRDSIHVLLDVKAKKIRNVSKADNDLVFGLQTELNWSAPFEVLYILRVREADTKEQVIIDHPLLRTPLAGPVVEYPPSGRNEEIESAIEATSKLLGFDLDLPWEKSFQDMPKSNTLSIIQKAVSI